VHPEGKKKEQYDEEKGGKRHFLLRGDAREKRFSAIGRPKKKIRKGRDPRILLQSINGLRKNTGRQSRGGGKKGEHGEVR